MRALFFILVLANVLFLAWTKWIDVPRVRSDALAGVPRLRLITPAPGSQSAAVASAPAGSLGAALATQSTPSAVARATSGQCVSLGPFVRNAAVGRALALAQPLGPQERITPLQPVTWYWVYLPVQSGARPLQRALAKLKHAGVHGDAPTTTAGGTTRISLGMFQEQVLAQRRQARVRAKGFPARLTERLVARPQYWIDLWIAGGVSAPELKHLQAQIGGGVAAESCPPGTAVPNHAIGPVSPGIPAS
jgi:hypothetical protein